MATSMATGEAESQWADSATQFCWINVSALASLFLRGEIKT